MMGPGGAYGPASDTGAPYPGQPVQLGMAKPGTVKGIQAILWFFTALSLLGDLFSIISLADTFTPLGLVTLTVAVYFTVQSLLSPIHIERGKRWAWIWSVVSAVLGLAAGLVAIVLGIAVSQYSALPLVIGFALGALYGVLLVLLLSKSARAWILMHRIQRGEVQAVAATDAQGAAGPDGAPLAPNMMNTQQPPQPERPAHKPGVVTVVQVLLLLLAIPAFVVFPQQLEDVQHEADIWGYPALSDYLDNHSESMFLLIGIGVAGLAVLVVNALIAWGLGKGRKGARIFGAIWLGAVFVAMGVGSPYMHMFMREQEDDTMSVDGRWVDDPFEATWLPIAFWVLSVGAVLALVAFILVLARGTRSWTPGRPPSIVIVQQPMR